MATDDRATTWQEAKAKRDEAIEAARLPNGNIDAAAVEEAKAEWSAVKAKLLAEATQDG